ncbi:MAG: spermidine/putrescine ABC transporter permease [Acidocella sp. 20-57-95]|nr:MAG: spermidine/putrescine ABC transporter permease [Acidocella sp. 20-57-95]OYV58043.1 MAG: spermidine/putrescine ABC transporter permease [Acidocella sp. 21-58-7]HQT64198.1 ABC transporter permease [Acidocella sp.]
MALTAAQSDAKAKNFRLWVTAGPGLFWIVLFLLVPSLVLLGIGFFTSNDYGSPVLPLTLTPFSQVAGNSLLGWDDGNIIILLRSLEQAGIATAVSALLSYPLVFFIMTRPEALRPLLLLLIILPSWTNQVVRTYAWLELLGPNAPLSAIAHMLGIVPPDLGIAPGSFAVTTGLAYNYLPYMIVPLYASAERLDWTLVEAGRDLYASGARLFWHTVFPQTIPGLLSGVIFVAIPAFGDYVVPQLLGGDKALMIGSLIANQFTETPDWPYGAALTIIMLVFTGLGLVGFRILTRKLGGAGEATI